MGRVEPRNDEDVRLLRLVIAYLTPLYREWLCLLLMLSLAMTNSVRLLCLLLAYYKLVY